MTLAPRNFPAVRDVQIGRSTVVPHLDLEAVHGLIEAAFANPRYGPRNGLLIATLFDG